MHEVSIGAVAQPCRLQQQGPGRQTGGASKRMRLACRPCWLKKVRDSRALAELPSRPSCRAGVGRRLGAALAAC